MNLYIYRTHVHHTIVTNTDTNTLHKSKLLTTLISRGWGHCCCMWQKYDSDCSDNDMNQSNLLVLMQSLNSTKFWRQSQA